MLRPLVVTLMVLGSNTAEAQTDKICDAYQEAAARGSTPMQTEFAYCLLRGIGRPADVGQAIELLELAQAKGFPKAQAFLASVYLFEVGDTSQFGRAEALLRAALESGYPGAHMPLAALYHNGLGVPVDDKAALRHLAEARNLGDVLAAFVVFSIERLGLYGTEENPAAASSSLAIFDSLIEADPLLERSEYLRMLATDPFTSRFLLEPEELVQAVGLVTAANPAASAAPER